VAKNISFGFFEFACVLAKTKCAICAVGSFSNEAQRSGYAAYPAGYAV